MFFSLTLLSVLNNKKIDGMLPDFAREISNPVYEKNPKISEYIQYRPREHFKPIYVGYLKITDQIYKLTTATITIYKQLYKSVANLAVRRQHVVL